MKYIGLSYIVFIGMNFGVIFVGIAILVVFLPGGYDLPEVYAVWFTGFCAAAAVGYFYARMRGHDRMRRVMLQQPYLQAMHMMALLVWNYCIPA